MKCKCKGATSAKGNKGDKGDAGSNGSNGAAGAPGTPGVALLYMNIIPETNTGTPDDLMNYTLPINKLATDGDSLEIIGLFDVNVTTDIAEVLFYINSTLMHIKIPSFVMPNGVKYCKIKFIVTRKSATTVFVDMEADYTGAGIYTALSKQATFESSRTVGNLTTNTNVILFSGGTVGAAILSQQKMSVTLIKI